MIKGVLILLCLLGSFLSVSAIDFEAAIDNNEKIFLYIGSSSCITCMQFNPVYDKLIKNYANKCKFIKLDAYSQEGFKIAKSFGVDYFPYVLTINSSKKEAQRISARCLMNYNCVELSVKELLNN